jgi:hypothetical protein
LSYDGGFELNSSERVNARKTSSGEKLGYDSLTPATLAPMTGVAAPPWPSL